MTHVLVLSGCASTAQSFRSIRSMSESTLREEWVCRLQLVRWQLLRVACSPLPPCVRTSLPRQTMTTSRPKAIDLFCGAGGMSLGFEQAGVEVIAAFDVEQRNVDTYSANFRDTPASVVDLSITTAEQVREVAGLCGELDILFGGPPCQGFSIGGHRRVGDPRNSLVLTFARLLAELSPRYFVMENVNGFMSHYAKATRESFLDTIKRAGYGLVAPIQILNAADYGVPQRRKRVFVLGFREGESPPSYPMPSKGQACVRDAISDLPEVSENSAFFDCDLFAGVVDPHSAYARRLAGLESDPGDLSVDRAGQPPAITGFLRTRHSAAVQNRFAATRPGAAEPVSQYHRLSADGLSPTLRAGTGPERGKHTAPRPIHPYQPRCITAREAARLHSFPDWFVFHGTRWHDFRQIGNSVPPLLARAVARSLSEVI